MTQKKLFKLVAPAITALVVAGGCKAEDDGDDVSTGPVTSGTTTMTATGTGTGVAPLPTTSATTGTTTPMPTTGATGTTPMPTTGTTTMPTGTGTEAPAPACMNTAGEGVDLMGAMGSLGSTWLFTYSDATTAACAVKTTHCLDTATAGTVRFFGEAAAAMSDYSCWGAGIGIQMARADDAGVVQQAWDAAALGIAGVKLTFTGVAGGPKLRAQIAIDGLPDDGTYVHGKGTKDIGTDGEAILMFADFAFPTWTLDAHPELEGVAMDLTKIKSLQIQVTTAPAAEKAYDFRISAATWIDANMMPVAVTPIPAPMTGEGGAGGMGGMGGMNNMGGGGSGDTGGAGGSGGTGEAGGGGMGEGGGGGGGGDGDALFDAAWEVMKASCAGAMCHGDDHTDDHPLFASMTRETALTAATGKAADIITRINMARPGSPGMPGPMPPMMALSAEDIATLQAWVDSL